MEMNRKAMQLLQRGELEESHLILLEALTMVQNGLVMAQQHDEGDRLDEADPEKVQREAWLLSLALTISNLGCQLRKAGKSEAALQFLFKARDAETSLYGKPSTSTMLNISAVALGQGDLKEALEMAQECVAASAEGDQMLHITALHNLAVALAQQPEAHLRGEALQTMQRALSHAEQQLGISHSTTIYIRERCLNTDQWIADEGYVQQIVEERKQGVLGDFIAVHPTLPPSHDPSIASHGDKADLSEESLPHPTVVSRRQRKEVTRSSPKKRRSAKDSTSPKKPTSARQPKKPSTKPKKAAKANRGSSRGPSEPQLLSEELQLRAKRALESLNLTPMPYSADMNVPRVIPPNKRSYLAVTQSQPLPHSLTPLPSAATPSQHPLSAALPAILSNEASLPPQQSGNLPSLIVPALASALSGGPKTPEQERVIRCNSGLENIPMHPIPEYISPRSNRKSASQSYAEEIQVQPMQSRSLGDTSGQSYSFRDGAASIRSFSKISHASLMEKKGKTPEASLRSPLGGVSWTADDRQPSQVDLEGIGPISASELVREPVGRSMVSAAEASRSLSGSHEKPSAYTNDSVAPQEVQHSESGLPDTEVNAMEKSDQKPPHKMREHEKNSFLRFGEVQVREVDEPFSPVTYKTIREQIRQTVGYSGRSRKVNAARIQVPSAAAEGHTDEILEGEEKNEKAAQSRKPRSAFQVSDIQTQREKAKEQQRKEEMLFKAQRLTEEMEQQEKERFNAALQVIQDRTNERAATLIQQIWRHWWRKVGKPRRELQLFRETERQKRVHHRIVSSMEKQKPSSKSDWTLQGLPPPIILVRCKNKWMKKTECLRYLARKHLYHYSRSEEEVKRLITLVQARMRGVLARNRYSRTQTLRQSLLEEIRPLEEREYAAIVIQKMVRCHAARQVRQRTFKERFEAAAIVIQEWYRSVLFDQRARGVDTRHQNRQLSAAVVIQRYWRGYLGRVKFYMAKLRRQMDDLRAAEAQGVRTLQRVGRGMQDRKDLGHHAIECCMEEYMATHYPPVEPPVVPPKYPEIVFSDYEKSCLERADAVYEQNVRDREAYDIPLHLIPEAEAVRESWRQATRVAPFQVRCDRAEEDLRCVLEHQTLRRERAAIKIQREFRAWLLTRNSTVRDSDYLLLSKGVYHQREYERLVQEKEYLRHLTKGVALYGDSSVKQREAVEETKKLLKEEQAKSLEFTPSIRSREERAEAEKRIRKNEEIVARNYERSIK